MLRRFNGDSDSVFSISGKALKNIYNWSYCTGVENKDKLLIYIDPTTFRLILTCIYTHIITLSVCAGRDPRRHRLERQISTCLAMRSAPPSPMLSRPAYQMLLA